MEHETPGQRSRKLTMASDSAPVLQTDYAFHGRVWERGFFFETKPILG